MALIHASHVYIELKGIYCPSCKKWTSRKSLLIKLRRNPKASCSNCGGELYGTILGERTSERIAIERSHKQDVQYIN